MSRDPAMVLAGDVGGTKTRLAIFSAGTGLDAPLAEAAFASGDYPNLESLVREFLSRNGTGKRIDHASFGVAGPVVNGRAEITNLPWVMEESVLADALGFSSVHLLNDILACACAVPFLPAGDLHTLNRGLPDPGGAMAVVAPGTGLGEAYLTWDGTGYRAHPSEGGHADFAPANGLETGLLRHLQNRFDHVSYERICSGSGLPNIYAYLKETGHAAEPAWLARQLAAVHDPAPVIVKAALDADRPCALCQATLTLFVSVLGAEAGNMALKVMASGGVYLGGGIPPRIVSALRQGPFLDAFRRKGRMSGLLERIPVHVVLNPRATLLGAACQVMAPGGREERRSP